MRGNFAKIFLYSFIVFTAIFALAFFTHYYVLTPVASDFSKSHVTIGGMTTIADVAVTEEERQMGLSGRPSLREGTGMLFIFERPDRWTFWMPNMHFAVDIVWIGEDRRIISIAHGVSPESYPKTFSPTAPALYVLEVPAGTAERYGWKTGDFVSITK